MSTTRQLVMVIGPGRSGTSVLTKVLAELGYHIPQPEIAADETNPSGFGESAWMVDFHREMLKASQVQNADARPAAFVDTLATAEEKTEYRDRAAGWLDVCFAEADFILVKDPRLLWFTTLWEQVAAELDIGTAYVTTLRHPTEVVASKQQWYESAQTTTNQLAAWMNGMLYTERATRGRSRGFVEFDTILNDVVGAVTALDAQAGLPPVRQAMTRQYRLADELVDPALRRTTATWEDLNVPDPVRDLANRIWNEVTLLPSTEGPSAARDAELDALRAEYGELYSWAEALTQSSAIAARRAGVREGRQRERRKRSARTQSERAKPERAEPQRVDPTTAADHTTDVPAADTQRDSAFKRVRRRVARVVPAANRRFNPRYWSGSR